MATTANLGITKLEEKQAQKEATINEAFDAFDAALGPDPRPYALVTHNANQSIANATLTALAFNTETVDASGMHDNATNNTRLTLNRTGLWLVSGSATFALNGTGERLLQVRKNGDNNLREECGSRPGSATVGAAVGKTILIRATAVTDYVELMAYQTSGGALNVETISSPVSPRFSAVWISN